MQATVLEMMKKSARESVQRAREAGWYGNNFSQEYPDINKAGLLRKAQALEKHAPFVREAFDGQTFGLRDYARKRMVSSSKASDDLRWMVKNGVLEVIGRHPDNAKIYKVAAV